MRAWFSEERMQQLGYFSLIIARELRIEDVNAFQASKALRNCSMSFETITPAIGISINPLYTSNSFMSNLKKKTQKILAAFYQCLH